MSLKALKNSDNKICVDTNGNILLVNAEAPGPGPGPVLDNGIVTTYDPYVIKTDIMGSGPVLTDVSIFASDWEANLFHETQEMYMRFVKTQFNGQYNQAFVVPVEGQILQGIPCTDIAFWSNLSNIMAISMTSQGGIIPPALYAQNLISKEINFTLDNCRVFGGQDERAGWITRASWNNLLFIGMLGMQFTSEGLIWNIPASDTSIYQYCLSYGIDLSGLLQWPDPMVWVGGGDPTYDFHYTISLPKCRYLANPVCNTGKSCSASIYLSDSFSMWEVWTGNIYPLMTGSYDLYINKISDTVPSICTSDQYAQSLCSSSDTVCNLYVPQEMVDLYNNDGRWNATNIYAYDFETNTIL